MRSTLFLGLFVTGIGAAAVAGCGGDTQGTGGSTGGAATTSSSTSSSSSSSSSGTTSSSSSSGGTTSSVITTSSSTVSSLCATTAATAQDIVLNDQNPTACNLPDPLTDGNYFKFSGLAGDAIVIVTSAKIGTDPFDPTYLDTVVTLYDSQMSQVARNDDPSPRYSNDAELWTVLPADGDYIIAVQECNGVFSGLCADSTQIVNNDYTVQVFQTDSSAPVVTSELTAGAASTDMPNDASDPTVLTAIKYEFGSTTYLLSRILGLYDTGTDVDVYSFTMPTDTDVNADGRALGNFIPFPAGIDGDGSTTPIGAMWIVDPADLTHKVAEIDASVGAVSGDIGAPLVLGKEYYLFVSKPAGAAGSNDFYVINHYGGGSNPIELSDTANNMPATAEVLTDAGEANFLASYFVDGNLGPITDVDFYSLAVPAGAATVSAACGAQRSGSGLRDLKFSLHTTAAGNPLIDPAATMTEVADDDVFIDNAPVPAGATTILLKVVATSQDATVTSNFYRCGVRFQ